MSLQSLTLKNFRSYKEASFEFSEGVNIIIGPNAVGKTNLLEGVYYSALGHGFRSKRDVELINNKSDWARIDAIFDSQERTALIEKSATDLRVKKRFIFGGNQKGRLSFDDLRPLVLFQPDDLRMVNGSPTRRRDYVDGLLSQLTPGYRQDTLAYNRILLQRNSVLKISQSHNTDQLFVWNMQLAERGGRIVQRRLEILNMLSNKISKVYSHVAGHKHKLEICYKSDIPVVDYSSALLSRLGKSQKLDKLRGYTSFGPHRDDIDILIGGKLFKQVASRGECRTLVLALKILELELLESHRSIKPLLLLDDVFSELDGSRRKLLTDRLKDHQTLITTTDADVLEKQFSKKSNIISVVL